MPMNKTKFETAVLVCFGVIEIQQYVIATWAVDTHCRL
jgi:hypothetical protein